MIVICKREVNKKKKFNLFYFRKSAKIILTQLLKSYTVKLGTFHHKNIEYLCMRILHYYSYFINLRIFVH